MLGALLEKMLTEGVHMFDDHEPVSVLAEITAKAGHEEEVRVILHELVIPSRSQAGCNGYHLLEDKQHPGNLSTYAEWAELKFLETHLTAPSTMAAFEKVRPMLAGEMKLKVFRKLV